MPLCIVLSIYAKIRQKCSHMLIYLSASICKSKKNVSAKVGIKRWVRSFPFSLRAPPRCLVDFPPAPHQHTHPDKPARLIIRLLFQNLRLKNLPFKRPYWINIIDAGIQIQRRSLNKSVTSEQFVKPRAWLKQINVIRKCWPSWVEDLVKTCETVCKK